MPIVSSTLARFQGTSAISSWAGFFIGTVWTSLGVRLINPHKSALLQWTSGLPGIQK
jgi:hypothetical protein